MGLGMEPCNCDGEMRASKVWLHMCGTASQLSDPHVPVASAAEFVSLQVLISDLPKPDAQLRNL